MSAEEKKDVEEVEEVEELVVYKEYPGTSECPLKAVPFEITGDLQTDNAALKKHYADYKPLPKRKFASVTCRSERSALEDYELAEQTFRVLQFNMLADGLSGSYFAKPETNPKCFVGAPTDAIKWGYRGVKIAEVLMQFEADIICVEECDAPAFLSSYLAPDYSVHFSPKGGSAIAHTAEAVQKDAGFTEAIQMEPDGFLIAFKRSKFKLLSKQVIEKKKTASGVSALALRLVTSRRRPEVGYTHAADSEYDTNEIADDRLEFIVVCTHLKAKKAVEGEATRAAQIKELFDAETGALQNPRQTPIICCADLNATPDKNRYGYEPKCYPLLATLGLESAYGKSTGGEPKFTTHKKRAKGVDMHTIDYILSKSGYYRELKATALLDIPEVFGSEPMPSWTYPSDHIAIGAELTWRVLPPVDDVSSQKWQTDSDGRPETWPLPGQKWSHVERTGDWKKDLAALRAAYGRKFQPLTARKQISLVEPSAVFSSHRLTICQFNMLADGLCGGYIKVNDDKSFLSVDKECLRLQFRGLRLLEAALSTEPALVALQECDVPEFFAPYLEKAGYSWKWQEKFNSPIFRKVSKRIAKFREWPRDKAPFPMANDGLILAWKSALFERVAIHRFNSNETDSGLTALAVRLRHRTLTVQREGGEQPLEFIYVNTHLKSTKEETGEVIRVAQMKELFSLLPNEDKLPVILSCDLNANPVKNKKGYDPWCFQAITAPMAELSPHGDEGHGYQSIYTVAKRPEPDFTTWKLRKHGTDKHTIDYIFMRYGKWRVVSYLEMPDADTDAKFLIPSWSFPSDHFPLVFELDWDDARTSEIGC